MKRAVLIVEKGKWPGARYELEESETLIGRGPAVGISLADKGVSREHAVILREEDDFTLEDLQSTNGTRVNGKRVRTAVLQAGDEIQVGETVFAFQLV